MKYSFILPYYDRAPQLKETLTSFYYLYGNRKDWEVVIIEDYKNKQNLKLHNELFNVISNFDINIKLINGPTEISYSPVKLYNLGVKYAQGKFIIISNPECSHVTNILQGFDEELEFNENAYVICACKAIKRNKFHMWYQHTKYRDKKYHFCTCLSKTNYESVGGFDERFSKGYCFDDDAFIARIQSNPNIEIITRDDLLVIHQEHKKIIPNKKLWLRNQKIYKDNY